MENPEAIFDVLSIRSMKEKYYASSAPSKSNAQNVTKTSVFTPTPSAAIATDLAFLANQEALEHFVQDFAIDDSISDCFADTETPATLNFPSKAPSRVNQDILTSSYLNKRDTTTENTLDINPPLTVKVPSPTKSKVIFAAQTSTPANHVNHEAHNQVATMSQPMQQNTMKINAKSNGASSAKQTNNLGLYYSGILANVGTNKTSVSTGKSDILHYNGTLANIGTNRTSVSAGKSDVFPLSGDTQGQVTLTQSQKVDVRGKVARAEREKEHNNSSVSKFHRFGLSWVKSHALHKGRKHQNMNTNNMAPEGDLHKTTKIHQNKPFAHDKDVSDLPNSFAVKADVEKSPKDYTISSIGVIKSNDDMGSNDILVTPRNKPVVFGKSNTDQLLHTRGSSHKPTSQLESANSSASSALVDSLNNKRLSSINTATPQGLRTNSNDNVNPRGSQGHGNSSTSGAGKLNNADFNTTVPFYAKNKIDPEVSNQWYKGTSSGDVSTTKVNPKFGSKFTPKTDNNASLCDVINVLAESEKDSEFSFGSKSNGSKRRSIGSECSSLRSVNATNFKGLVSTKDSMSVNNKDGVTNTDQSKTEKSNNCENLDDPSRERSRLEVPIDEDVEEKDESGLLGDVDGLSSQNLVLNLICGELVRRCLVLEGNKERCLSCLKTSVPEACSSLIEASNQMKKLGMSLETVEGLDKEVTRQLQAKTEGILSTATSLTTTMSSLEETLNDNHVNHENHSCQDNHGSLDGSKVFGALKSSTSEMLKNGVRKDEIKNSLQELLSKLASNKTHPLETNRESGSEDVKDGANSLRPNSTKQPIHDVKIPVLNARNTLGPKNSYLPSKENGGYFNTDTNNGKAKNHPKMEDSKIESSPEKDHGCRIYDNHNATMSRIPNHHTTTKNNKITLVERHKQRRSQSSSRLHNVSGSSDILNDSSSGAEETPEAFARKTGSALQSNAKKVRGRHHRRRSHSAARHRSRSRRNSSCYSCHSDGNSKFRSNEFPSISGAKVDRGTYWSDDEISERKCAINSGFPTRNIGDEAKNKLSNSKRKDFGLSRSELARYRRERKHNRGRNGRVNQLDDIDRDVDDVDDDDDEDDDDDDGESTKVCVNVPNEECSDNALRIQRLKQHLHSMQKLRQKSRDVIETVVTGTGERLTPRPSSREGSHGSAHVNIGEAYPFKSQPNFDNHQLQDPSQDSKAQEKGEIVKTQSAKVEKPWGFFKGKRGVTSHLFNHKRLETPQEKVRELTESEFEETFERRNDVTVRRRREMDAGIPWDELEFSGLESDATLTCWSDGER